MKLIFLRHGIAEAKTENQSDMDDFCRKLTHEGIVQTKDMAQHLRYLFKDLNIIFTSPLVRAVQTAQVLYRDYSHADFEFLPELDKLSDPQNFLNVVRNFDSRRKYCFVGHEPHLTGVIELILSGQNEARVTLTKSGVAVLEGKSFADLKLTALFSPRAVMKISS